MNKKTRVFAYSAIATSLIFGSAFISGCGDSGSTTPAFPASSSTSTPSTEPTPNDPSTPTTPATPSTPNTPNTPNPEQPTEETSRQISLQFDSKSIAELQNLKVVKARYLVAKDLDDGEGQAKLLEGTLNLDSEAKEMAIKDVPQDANTITCFYYNEGNELAAVGFTRLKLNNAKPQQRLGKLAKDEAEEVETSVHSVKDATWELKSDKAEVAKDEYVTYTLKLVADDNTVIDNVIGLADSELDIPQIDGKDCLAPASENIIGRYQVVEDQSSELEIGIRLVVTDSGIKYIKPNRAVFLVGRDYMWEFSYNPQDNTVCSPTTVSLKLSNYDSESATAPKRNNIEFINGFEFYPNSQKNYVFSFKDNPLEYVSANCIATALLAEDKMVTILSDYASPENGVGVDVAIKPYELDKTSMVNYGSYSYLDKVNFVTLVFPFAKQENSTEVFSGASGEIAARGIGSHILSGIASCLGYPILKTPLSSEKDFPAFEEAFKDILALYMSSQDIDVCRLAVKQCQGDWKKSNCLAALGEEVGQYGGHDCLRLLINDRQWSNDGRTVSKDFTALDYQEWGLIFSGAYYDIMTGIAQRNIDSGMDSALALKAAGQEAMELLVKGLHSNDLRMHGDQDSYMYRKVAIAMLKIDAQSNGGRNTEIITKVMKERKILQEDDSASTVLPHWEK